MSIIQIQEYDCLIVPLILLQQLQNMRGYSMSRSQINLLRLKLLRQVKRMNTKGLA